MSKEALRAYFDELAPVREHWTRKNWYYHAEVARLVKFLVPPGKRVLEVGAGRGNLLAALEPSRGVGIDLSPAMVQLARQKYPGLQFEVMDAEELKLDERFDYVIMSDLIGDLQDVGAALERLHAVVRPDTRVVITYYNHLWEPVLKLAEKLGGKTRQNLQNWLHLDDIENLLYLADFERIRKGYHLLLPKPVPGLSRVVNRYGALLPGVNRLSLIQWMVARPRPARPARPCSVSVVIPCKNEAGNIAPALERLPAIGTETEVIFVDGNSTDGTVAKIEAAIAKYGDARKITLVHQGDGRGKGDAVRKGFEAATGEVLMILDADLTVAPEDLPKFYDALLAGKGEFVNGSRLVYPMESQAMRFLNFLGNKFFGLAFSWLLGQRITDTLCGTKVLSKRDYEAIKAGRSYFGNFDPFGDFDLLFGAARLNLRLVDLPIRYHDRTYGTTKISRFRHGLLLLRMCGVALKRLKLLR
jgi:ubiquinone/menaquinone biosynthesis C-methylase UbiE